MEVQAWDSVFVRARRADVHQILRDPSTYGGWWPGLTVEPVSDGALALRHRPPGRLLGSHAVTLTVTKERPELGVNLAYAGDLDGAAEWYYLDEVDGTVVHYLLRARAVRRRPRALLGDHRASVRAALHALKDRLEGPRMPGAEPDTGLLSDQREAAVRFKAGVEAHALAQSRRGRR